MKNLMFALLAALSPGGAAEGVAFVLDASPARLDRMMRLDVPLVRVAYRFVQQDGPALDRLVLELLPEA